jgi:hypothetical protein
MLPKRRRWSRSVRAARADPSNSVIKNRRKHVALRAQAHLFAICAMLSILPLVDVLNDVSEEKIASSLSGMGSKGLPCL